jgi:2-polyprenyl-3-methyl-5-hydroxy-6-metoxy-1,4-benzoquinol methylase
MVGEHANWRHPLTELGEALDQMQKRGKEVEDLVSLEKPELLSLFIMYQNEAIEARKLLHENLLHIGQNARVLEVGGGILALAVQLASEGYRITTVEPVGDGFTGISWIMDKFSLIAKRENLTINLLQSQIENCTFEEEFTFIFSINVMEHLSNPYSVLVQLSQLLENNGFYRFICPNYDFPYEPHFGKWLSRRDHGSFILEPSRVNSNFLSESESIGLYKSLNYITLRKIRKHSRHHQLELISNKNALHALLIRSMEDQQLRNRHPALGRLISLLFTKKTLTITKFLPSFIQPTMDVTIKRK